MKLILALLIAATGQAAIAAPDIETPVAGNRLEITRDGRLVRAWYDPAASGEAVRIEGDFPVPPQDIPVRCDTVSPAKLREAAAHDVANRAARSGIPAVDDLYRVAWLAEQRLGAEAQNVLYCETERRLPLEPTASEHASSSGMLSTVTARDGDATISFRAVTVLYPQRIVVVAFDHRRGQTK